MEERPTGTEQLQAARNRKRCGCGCAVVSVKVERGGARQVRQQTGCGKNSHCEASLFKEASTAQQSFCEMAMTWKYRAICHVGS
jgi:hypothetical protein